MCLVILKTKHFHGKGKYTLHELNKIAIRNCKNIFFSLCHKGLIGIVYKELLKIEKTNKLRNR